MKNFKKRLKLSKTKKMHFRSNLKKKAHKLKKKVKKSKKKETKRSVD